MMIGRLSAVRLGAAYPLVRLVAALALMTIGGAGMYAAIVTLKPVSLEFGVSRGDASIAYALFMLGFGLGGVAMSRLADRAGVMTPVMIGALALPAGLLAAAQAETFWQFSLALSVLCGVGASASFAPLIADISHWFTRRRGLAVAVVISGSYTGGAAWPPTLQYLLDLEGWRETFIGVALFTAASMALLGLILAPRPRLEEHAAGSAQAISPRRGLGMSPRGLQCAICAAGVGCCAAMAMPQAHIVAYATDLGFAAQRGAEMLSLMLGFGIVSRLVSGWISDRIGGLRTLLLGSLAQCLVLVAFLFADTLSALYATSAAFGLAQGGVVPSYAIIVRTYFPAGEAGWRIATAMLFTVIGMALGGWMAGMLYDLSGDYTLSFLNAIAFNIANFAIGAALLARANARAVLAAQTPAG